MSEIREITPLPLIRPLDPRDSDRKKNQKDDPEEKESGKKRPEGGDNGPLVDEYA